MPLKGWIRRMRHRRGFGIHSPLAYSLVRGALFPPRLYGWYGDRTIRNIRSLTRERKLLLLRLMHTAAWTRTRTASVYGRKKSPDINLALSLGGCRVVGVESNPRLIVDLHRKMNPDDASGFLAQPGRILLQSLPPAFTGKDSVSDASETELPGDLIMVFRDYYIAFSNPGMARTVYDF